MCMYIQRERGEEEEEQGEGDGKRRRRKKKKKKKEKEKEKRAEEEEEEEEQQDSELSPEVVAQQIFRWNGGNANSHSHPRRVFVFEGIYKICQQDPTGSFTRKDGKQSLN